MRESFFMGAPLKGGLRGRPPNKCPIFFYQKFLNKPLACRIFFCKVGGQNCPWLGIKNNWMGGRGGRPGWDIPEEPGNQAPKKYSGSHNMLVEIQAFLSQI